MKTRTRNGIITVATFCFLIPLVVSAQGRVLTLPAKQESKDKKEEQIIVTQPKPGEEIDQAKARAALNTMYTALGGQKWLNRGDYVLKGHTSSFYKNEPTGVGEYIQFHRALPNNQWEDRIELTKKRDIVQIWTPTEGVEVTYRGRKPLPKEDQDAYFRRIHYSIDSIANTWLTDPKTLLVYGGHKVVARREVDEVTLIDKNNDSVTVDIELSNHYPLRRVFQFRNEKYKDFDEDVEEYSDWHEIDGIPTPFVTTRYFNGDMVAQRFVEEIHYKPVDPALFAPNAPVGKHKD
ncbi:MAG TPA: hypothetical protein VIM67_03765 [Terriglobus sp.]